MALVIEPFRARSILSPAHGYIGAYDYTLSPYAGCTGGCSYCYVPTLAYFYKEARTWGRLLRPKENAPELLLKDGRNGEIAGSRIFMSPNTDPYVGQEKKWRITRRLLEVFCEYPPELLVIQTRFGLVTRDLDLITRLGESVIVAISVTTNREDVRQSFERFCQPIETRVDALAALHAAGVTTQASLAPLLPCDPIKLAQLVDPHSTWATVQALKMGAGARTWRPAIDILERHDLRSWLQGGKDVQRAMSELRAFFGNRYHEGREGFSMRWVGRPLATPGQPSGFPVSSAVLLTIACEFLDLGEYLLWSRVSGQCPTHVLHTSLFR